MRSRHRLIVECLGFIALLAVLAALVPSDAPAVSPYASALASLGVPSALAAGTCNNKACSSASHGLKFTCISSSLSNCNTVRGGQDCAVSAC